ncbi:unnamed protein product [Cylindrotheca closterium]|uniref:Uncharacterized protein n=1 Tax=Cylindrotheca closterium TaxID=2856 RepID=A0AAD2FVL6_9STRA|nr:unnamed protein product [Cylindrotheca closterium]
MAGSSSGGKSDAGRDVHVTKRKQAEVNESDIRPSQCQEHLGDAAAKSPDKDILLATSDVSKKGKVSTTPTAAKVPVSSQEEDDLAVVVAKCWNDFLSAEFSLGKTYSGLPLSLNYGKYQELLSGQGNFVSKVNKALFVMFPEDYKNKCAKDLLIPVSNAEDYPMLNCDPSLATNTTILDLPAKLVGEDEEYTEGDAAVSYYQGIQENAESFDKHHVDFDIQILGEELDWIYWTGNKELKAVGGKKGVEGLGKILHRIKAIKKSGKGAAIDFFKDKKAKNTSKKVRLAEDLHHFWKPKENKRKRVNNIGLSAEQKQQIKNEELNAICDGEQPNQHMEIFEERLMQSELLLQAKKPNENNSKIISRVNKATQDYQKELNKQYRNVDQGTLEFVSKYKIKAPKQNQYSHDEIQKIRYEPITFKPTFPVTAGFALTIDKAQGQTLDRVIIAISERLHKLSNFTYACIYVGNSRVKESGHLRLLLHNRSSKRFQWEMLTYVTELKPAKSIKAFFSGFTTNRLNWKKDVWNQTKSFLQFAQQQQK